MTDRPAVPRSKEKLPLPRRPADKNLKRTTQSDLEPGNPEKTTPLESISVAKSDNGPNERVEDQSPLSALEERAIIAYFDGLDPRGYIAGWAWIPQSPERRVAVSAYVGEELISFGTSNLHRDDVHTAGHGDGQYGYLLEVPESLLDGRTKTLSLRFEATGIETYVIETEVLFSERVVGRKKPRPVSDLPLSRIPALPQTSKFDRPVAVYVPGQQIFCYAPHPLPPYHVQGWHNPEAEFTWIDGLEGVIEMVLRRPQNAYTFTLDVVPNGVGKQLQTLEIFVNYFRIGFFEIPDSMSISVQLPSEIFILRRTQISLHCRNAVNPAAHGIPDSRRLGIAVSSWIIS